MKDKIKMIIFVMVLGSVLTGALLIVDAKTAPLIKRNQEIKVKLNVLRALGFEATKETAEKVFAASVTERASGDRTLYRSAENNTAFKIDGPGLWGPIEGVLAVGPDLKTVSGITIISQEETPGLGDRIAADSYLAQYKGKKLVPGLVLVGEGKSASAAEIDGITGATMSCKAFLEIVNQQYGEYVPVLQGKGGAE